MSAKYQFIYDDILLIAELNSASGKQWLVMQKINPRDGRVLLEDRVECIHTAISTMGVGDFEKQPNQEMLSEAMLQLRSSEGTQEIRLPIEDKFFAFKSWVAGIAEAGVNAITIQTDIEQYAHLMTPIANRLFNFLLRAKLAFIQDFLKKMEQDCVFEGQYHKPSIHANLLRVLEIMILNEGEAWNIWRDQVKENYEWHDTFKLYLVKYFHDLMEGMFDFRPSAKIFLERAKFNFVLTLPGAKQLPDWQEVTRDAVIVFYKLYTCYTDKDSGLKALDLSSKGLTSTTQAQGLDQIPNLQQLHLETNKFQQIPDLKTCPHLRRLYLTNNSIVEIEHLDNLPELEILYLAYNNIAAIRGLDHLPNLRELYLFNNQISRIEGLVNLPNLQVLNLAWNQIEEIKGLDNLPRLIRINLGGNRIKRVEGLDKLRELQGLDLYQNEISETPDLKYLPNLKELSLTNNPCFQERNGT